MRDGATSLELPSEELSSRAFNAAVLIGCVILLTPLAAATFPFLTDYLLHMGRAAILMRLRGQNEGFYQAHWSPLPNLAFDLIVPFLARFIGLAAVGKLFVGAAALLEATGGCALVVAVQRRRSAIALAPFLLTYNMVFEWGFLAYLFTLGLALWGAAAWVWTRTLPLGKRWPILAVPALLFIGHLAAFGVYVVLVICVELAALAEDRARVRANLPFFAGSLIPPALLHFGFEAVSQSEGIAWGDIKTRIVDLLRSPMMDASRHTAELSGSLLASIMALALVFRIVRFNRTGLFALAGISFCYLAVPQMMLGSAFAGMRMLAPLLLTLPACIELRGARNQLGMACGLGLLVAASCGATSWRWHSWDRSNQELVAISRLVPNGAMVLSAELDRDEWNPPRLWHGQEALLMARDVFLPSTILEAGQQPVAFSKPQQVIHDESVIANPSHFSGEAFSIAALSGKFDSVVRKLALDFRKARPQGANSDSYVLVRNAGLPAKLSPAVLAPLYEGEWYSLYHVNL